MKERFLLHIGVERRLSQKTVETYAESLKLFEDFLCCLSDPRNLETADSDNIRDWMDALVQDKHSVAYVNRSLAALRTFYKFCFAEGIVTIDPAHHVVGPKKNKRLPQFVRDGEMKTLLETLDDRVANAEDKNKFNVVRTRTIIYMFYLTGLRVSELISLDDSMIDMVSKELKVTGKRNKQRIVPFGDEFLNVIKDYIDVRDAHVVRSDDAFFVSDKGSRMAYHQVRLLVKENLSAISSLKKCSPHVLRHTFATSMLNNNASLESIKRLLGHQSVETTEVYTHVTFEQLKKAYNEAHPRG